MLALALAATLTATTHTYPAQPKTCYDGDTCTFVIDLGLGVQKTEDVRICDVDAPEMKGDTKEAATQAKRHVMRLLYGAERVALHVPQKSKCKDTNRCEYRSFDRLLAWVIVDGQVLGELMVRDGHAKPATKTCTRRSP